MPQPVNLRLITKEEVERLVTPTEVVDAVVDCFRALGEGKLVHPAKDPLWTNEEKTNMLLAMPAYMKESKVAGVKWVSMYKEQQPGIPSSWGNLLILNNGDTGVPYAIMDATAITAMRWRRPGIWRGRTPGSWRLLAAARRGRREYAAFWTTSPAWRRYGCAI